MEEKKSLAELVSAIPGVGTEDMGTLLNTGSYNYYRVMREHIKNGTCPFCQIDTNLNKVLYENKHWRIWENPVAKKDPAVERHLVIPAKSHIVDPEKIPDDYGESFFEIRRWAFREFNIPGGALIMRLGEVARNAGSIRHIHGNIKVPTGKLRCTETLAKDANDLERKGPTILIWEKMYQAQLAGKTPADVLTEEEKAVLEARA